MTSRSVAQIAAASIRTSTSARFGTGTGLSFSVSSPGSPNTQAFMVSGIGNSVLVFTPAGAYMNPPNAIPLNAKAQLATAWALPTCDVGSPNSADSARVAALISSRMSATCSSLARMVGVDTLIAPITVPASSRMAAPTQMTPGRMVASMEWFLPGRQGNRRPVLSQGHFQYDEC